MLLRTTCTFLVAAAAIAQVATVSFVVDGNTFAAKLNGKIENVRLNCIDVPEALRGHNVEAVNLLRRLIDRRTVMITESGRDASGRILADVHIDGQSVNRRLVEEGHARTSRTSCAPPAEYRVGATSTLQPAREIEARRSTPAVSYAEAFTSPAAIRTNDPVNAPAEPAQFGNHRPTVVNAESASANSTGTGTTRIKPVKAPAQSAHVEAHIERHKDGTEVYRSSGSADGRTVHTGPRGGKYTISPSGKKVYVRKSRR